MVNIGGVMDFDVYCDESYPDLFSTNKSNRNYIVIGSLWLQCENRKQFKEQIHELRDKHHIGGEFKWKKISPSKFDFYKDLIAWFFHKGDNLRFRCIVINKNEVNLEIFHRNDAELGFYKFYYQVLNHWILDNNNYNIFCDYKKNRRNDRWEILKECLKNSNISSLINNVQAINSQDSVLIQLVDVLTGVVSRKFNYNINGSIKDQLISYTEDFITKPINATSISEKKFNIFKIKLEGGW